MTARILVVDDIEANVRLLDAKLSAEYYEVISATDGVTALAMAAADEVLTKPIDDVVLFARVKSLTRLKLVIDELREREASGRRMGVIGGVASRLGGAGGRVVIVDDNARQTMCNKAAL